MCLRLSSLCGSQSEAERAELVAARAAARAEDGDEGQAWDVFDGEEPGGDLKAEGDLGE